MEGKVIVDIHIHIGAPENPEGLAYWSGKFERTAAFFAMKAMTGNLFKPSTEDRIRKYLIDVISGSEKVEKAVLLALDEVYDEDGRARKELTNFYVSNDYIKEIAEENNKVLKGYSLHPYRKDFKEEIDRVKQEAVLLKLIPSAQMFNPSSKRAKAFWKKAAEAEIPVLAHTGPEYAIPTSDESYNKYNDPIFLKPALDLGVTLIAAHCATPYFWIFDQSYKKHFEHLLQMFNEREKQGWNLYADISALATPTRIPYIKRIIDGIPAGRLFFGSDYPIPISTLGYKVTEEPKNSLDLYIEILKAAGSPEEIFGNWARTFPLK